MDFAKMPARTLFLRYVIPQMIGLTFNSVYFIVDGVFIGRLLGTTALAAAGVAVPVVEMTIALSMLVSVGAGVLISAAAGRGDTAAGRRVFNLAVAVAGGLGLALAALGGLFAGPLATALGADAALLPDTTTYLRVYLLFCPFVVFSYALSGWVRNDGAPALAMWALTIGAVSNVVLDWVFMVPLGMGIGGAALATGLGPVFSVLILLPHFLRKKGSLYFERLRWRWRGIADIFTAGLPAFVAEFSIGFVTLLYNMAIVKSGLGERGLAGYMVIGYAALICLTAFLGAAQGLQPPVSYLHGSGDIGRIARLFRLAAAFCLVLALALYAALFFFGDAFFGVFLAGDAALLRETHQNARLYFLNLPFAAVNILLISFLQSMAYKGDSLALSLCRSTLPVLAFLWVLPLVMGNAGLWLAISCAEATSLVLGYVLWARRMGPDTMTQRGVRSSITHTEKSVSQR